MEKKKEFDQMAYISEFNKLNYKGYHVKINKKESGLIDWIESKPNKNGYILDLVRKDMKENKK